MRLLTRSSHSRLGSRKSLERRVGVFQGVALHQVHQAGEEADAHRDGAEEQQQAVGEAPEIERAIGGERLVAGDVRRGDEAEHDRQQHEAGRRARQVEQSRRGRRAPSTQAATESQSAGLESGSALVAIALLTEVRARGRRSRRASATTSAARRPGEATLQADELQRERDRVAGGETDDRDAGEHVRTRCGDQRGCETRRFAVTAVEAPMSHGSPCSVGSLRRRGRIV